MYKSAHFNQDDQKILFDFIKENPFALLVTSFNAFPDASSIPFELIEEDEIYLLGHISAANPQGKYFDKEDLHALVVFTAGHSYVSSSWYEKENVSTWNYRAVHVKGIIIPLQASALRDHLKRMQAKYESGQKNPRTVDTMSDEYFEKQVNGVKGFKIKIQSIEGSWKLSQNRNEKDFKNIITELEKKEDAGSKEIAAEMKKISR